VVPSPHATMTRSTGGAAVDSDLALLAERFPRVAIAHDWLSTPGGSEKVVEALLSIFPHAEIFTTVYDPARYGPPIADRPVHPSFLNRMPGARTHYPKLLPLMNAAWTRTDLRGFDLVISSSHACAKNVPVPAGVPHVCYSHTPIRYVWDPEFRRGERLGPVGSVAFRALLPMLRRADLRGAERVDRFVANSTVVAERIRRTYGRDSTVVHPPVDVSRYLDVPRQVSADAPYLAFGRVVPYKRVDLAVQACAALGRRLIVAGVGRDLQHVEALAGPETTFVGRVDDAQLRELFATSRALLFPGEEDFGIVPVEAQAAGLPVIGFARGGVRDSVRDAITGVLFEEPGVDGMRAAIERFESLELSEAAVRDNARAFGPAHFADGMRHVLSEVACERR
jgi:glycosyltransferase involved in cell wall biosynthesis